MKKLLLFLFVVSSITLSSCQSTDINKNFEAAYGANTVARNLAAELNDQEKITLQQAEGALEYTDETQAQLDALWTVRDVAKDETLTTLQKIIKGTKAYLNKIMGGDNATKQ